jgi:chemotaxis protein MotB
MAKRKRDGEGDRGVNVGLIMTISLFLILLTFFILLNSIAEVDERRTRIAIGSLMGAFGIFKGGTAPIGTGDLARPSFTQDMMEDADENELVSLVNKKMIGELKVYSKKGEGIITIHENTLFDAAPLKIKPSAKPLLNQLCGIINKGTYPIEIVAYTDNRPAEEKGYRSNWELSVLMAMKVVRYMVEDGKVPSGRITAYGSGDQKPIASNYTRISRAQNRRIDIFLDYKAQPHAKRIFEDKESAFMTYKQFDFRIH